MSDLQVELQNYVNSKLQVLTKYYIEIGVFTAKSSRKVKVGINNAELMFIHEHGSPLRHIPARPVLQMSIDYANSTLLPKFLPKICAEFVTTNDISKLEKSLNQLCIRLENYARQLIYSNDGRLAPNAISTIKKKKTNHPLFDTGQLARSITCRLVKK